MSLHVDGRNQKLLGTPPPSVAAYLEAFLAQLDTRAGQERRETLTLNPGIRAGFDVPGGLQIVPGLAVPIGLGPSSGEVGLFFYLSFEHPFSLAGPTDERS